MTPRTIQKLRNQERMLLGLNILETKVKPGERLTQTEIAAWCGCDRKQVQKVEVAAIRKIRRKVKAVRELREFVKW